MISCSAAGLVVTWPAAHINHGVERRMRNLPEEYQWRDKRLRSRAIGESPIYQAGAKFATAFTNARNASSRAHFM